MPLFPLVVACVSGFVALSYEVAWYRVVSFATWGRPAAFGVLLAAYLLGVALGSAGSRRFCRDEHTRSERSLVALGAFFLAANLASYLVAPAFARAATVGMHAIEASFGLVALAAAMMGATLPLLCHFAIDPDARAGQRLSYVYFANIVGSAAGSLVTGFVLLDRMTLPQTCTVLLVVGSLLGVTLMVRGATGSARAVARAVAGAVGVAVTGAFVVAGPRFYDRLYERLSMRGEFKESSRFAEVIENKSGVITVTEDGTVYGGGAYDGRLNTSIVYDRNGIVRAYALGAMHPAPREVLMIGLASGSWAQVIAHQPGVEKLTIVEINPGYLTLISHHPDVAGVLSNPKVHIEIDDGRRWLLRHPERRFDAVIQNTTWHWRAHMTNLLSREYLELVRSRLAPGGLFYFNTTSSEDAQKTAMTVFPNGLRVVNFVAVSDAPLSFDKARFAKILQEYRIEGKPAIDTTTDAGRALVAQLAGLADTLDAAPVHDGLERRESILARTTGARVVTDDNMAVELADPWGMFETP